jgi:hypothetical protein
MRNKKLLTWFLILSCVLLATIAFAGWVIYSFYARLSVYKPPEIPHELREARIVVGSEFLSRNQFVTTSESWVNFDTPKGVGSIEDISIGELDSHPGIDIAIAGRYGAMIVDRNGVKQSQIQYEFEAEQKKIIIFNVPKTRTMLGDVRVIDIEGDGTCEYLARGSLDGAAVFSHQGKRLWSYGAFTDEKTSIDDLAAGDLNGDGVSEFISSWDAIELFDRHGRKGWAQPLDGGLHQMEIVDVDGDRKNEIIHSSAGGLTVRDGLGKILKEVEMPFYLSHFHLCAKPDEQQSHILVVEDDNVWLVDFKGNVVKKFAAPLTRFPNPRKPAKDDIFYLSEIDVYTAKGVWVKLKADQPPFLAVVTEFAALDRSVLYIYSTEGRLVYQEVMPEGCSSIAVLSQEDGSSAQEFLVGGTNTVWRYHAR